MRNNAGRALLCGWALFGLAQGQSQKLVLFNGNDLTGWETQGPGTWSVANGEIRGLKLGSQSNWAHLVSKQVYGDGYLRVRYKVDSGNSGAYIRSEIGGQYGVTGLQVEMGGDDGSMMTVTSNKYTWLPTNPIKNPQFGLGQWHELGIDFKGRNATSHVNGKMIYQAKDLDTVAVPPRGKFSFQLHQSVYKVQIAIKSVELFLPTLIKGCMDPAYLEFQADANEPDSLACKQLKSVALRGKVLGELRSGRETLSWAAAKRLIDQAGKAALRDVQGRILWEKGKGPLPLEMRPGIFLLLSDERLYWIASL